MKPFTGQPDRDFSGSRRVVPDHQDRFLVSQPKDQVVVAGIVGQRVLLVVRAAASSLRRPRSRACGPRLLALPEQAHRPVECRRARHCGLFGPAFAAASRALSAAACCRCGIRPCRGPAGSRPPPYGASPPCEPGRAPLRGPRCRSDGRMLHAFAARSAVVVIVGALGEREDPLPGGGEFLAPARTTPGGRRPSGRAACPSDRRRIPSPRAAPPRAFGRPFDSPRRVGPTSRRRVA